MSKQIRVRIYAEVKRPGEMIKLAAELHQVDIYPVLQTTDKGAYLVWTQPPKN